MSVKECLSCDKVPQFRSEHGKACLRHVACWKDRLYWPSKCTPCQSNWSKATLLEDSERRQSARDKHVNWIKDLVTHRNRFRSGAGSDFDASEVWSSVKDREDFSADWCLELKSLGVGKVPPRKVRSSSAGSDRAQKRARSPKDNRPSKRSNVSSEDLPSQALATSPVPSPIPSHPPSSSEPSSSFRREVSNVLQDLAADLGEDPSDDPMAPEVGGYFDPHYPYGYSDDPGWGNSSSLPYPAQYAMGAGYFSQAPQDPRTFTSQPPATTVPPPPPFAPAASGRGSSGTGSSTGCVSPSVASGVCWFHVPMYSTCDVNNNILIVSDVDYSDLVELKLEGHFRIFRPKLMSGNMSSLIDCSTPFAKPTSKGPPKPSLSELLSASFRGGENPLLPSWGLSGDHSVINLDLSRETLSILGLGETPYSPPSSKELSAKFGGKGDALSDRVFRSLSEPVISDSSYEIGGPFEGKLSPPSGGLRASDLKRRQELLATVQSKSALELALSLSSNEAVSGFNLSTEASVHMSLIRKALEAANRLVSSVMLKASVDFSAIRRKLHLSVTDKISTPSVKERIAKAEVFSESLWSDKDKEELIALAREAQTDQTWSVSKSLSRTARSSGGGSKAKVGTSRKSKVKPSQPPPPPQVAPAPRAYAQAQGGYSLAPHHSGFPRGYAAPGFPAVQSVGYSQPPLRSGFPAGPAYHLDGPFLARGRGRGRGNFRRPQATAHSGSSGFGWQPRTRGSGWTRGGGSARRGRGAIPPY